MLVSTTKLRKRVDEQGKGVKMRDLIENGGRKKLDPKEDEKMATKNNFSISIVKSTY